MPIDKESLEEMRQDMLMENREESLKEDKRYDDPEYCMESFINDDIQKCIQVAYETLNNINSYGHNIEFEDLV